MIITLLLQAGWGVLARQRYSAGHAGIDLSKYLTINPDEIKEEMARRGMIPEVDKLSPMEASDLAHEESSYIAKRLALRAMTDGRNIIWDITMSSQESTEERINNLRDAAYTELDGVLKTSPRTSVSHERSGGTARATNSGAPTTQMAAGCLTEVIRRQLDSEWGSQNRRTYEAMKGEFISV